MAKKLYHIGLDKISKFITKNKKLIKEYIDDERRFELSKLFGRAYFDLAVNSFIKEFKIDKDLNYALYVLNFLKSNLFIKNIYTHLQLSRFETKKILDENLLLNYQKGVFYAFVYFLYENKSIEIEDIKAKLFKLYFFHFISTVKNPSNIKIDYKKMALSYIKGKDISIKESFKIDDKDGKAIFKILINQKEIIKLEGKSIKTLRKKAYKKVFFYLLDSYKDSGFML